MSYNLDDRTLVLAALQQAGITPTEEEVAAMVEAYPTVRQATASLYSVPGVRYEDPAITFDPRLGVS